MTARLVSAGAGDRRALVVCYLVGRQLDADLIAALDGALDGACIVAFDDPSGEPLITTQLRARDAGWRDGPLVLIGYSAGVLQGVRQRLLDGAEPAAVVAIDGTHAGLPPRRWQLEPWERLAAAARAGRRLFVATHTYLSYVERLADPYQATATTLRQATGWPLEHGGPLPLGVEHSDGALHVHSYESGPIDGQAHRDQLRVALPAMLRRYVAPWLARWSLPPRKDTPTPATLPTGASRLLSLGSQGPDVATWQVLLHELGHDAGNIDGIFGPVTDVATRAFQRVAGLASDGVAGPATRAAAGARRAPSDRPTTEWPSDLGTALLEQAQADLRAGVRETLGANDGTRIREYLAGTGAPRGSSWCAAALRFWLRAAAAGLAVALPIQGSVGAKATMVQLQRAKRWWTAEELRQHPERLRPGMIVVWHRGAPGAWTGHAGVCSRSEGLHFRSIEGNSGMGSSQVAEMHHHIGEAHLLGAGWVD